MSLLFVYLMAGFFLQKSQTLKNYAPKVLNKFILYVSLPAIIFLKTKSIPISQEALIPVAMPIINFGLSFLLFYTWGMRHQWSRGKIGAFVLLAGLGNTSFLGFPLIRSLYGEDFITYGLMVDQGGSFITVSTVGLIAASIFSGARVNYATIAKKVLLFPTTVAFFFALACLKWEYPESLKSILDFLGLLLGPAALISVGLQISLTQLKHYRSEILSILSFKMVALPLFFLAIALCFFEIQKPIIQITLFEALMPPMITAGIIAQEYGLEPEMAPNIVGSGILLVFALAPLWFWVLKTV